MDSGLRRKDGKDGVVGSGVVVSDGRVSGMTDGGRLGRWGLCMYGLDSSASLGMTLEHSGTTS